MKLSVITNDLNDHEETKATIRSLLETAAGKEIELIVIDDGSMQPLFLEEKDFDDFASPNQTLVLYRPKQRLGCGGSRHIGAQIATGDYLLFIDCHMRFIQGWYEAAEARLTLPGREKTMHCACCLGLDAQQMDPTKSKSLYTGATYNFYGRDPNIPLIEGKTPVMQVFEGIWKDHVEKDKPGQKIPLVDVEIPCVMGACYFIPRQFFFHIGGLSALKEWGSDEPYLSVKTWFADGAVRLLETVQIGHKFKDKQPYSVRFSAVYYNKIRAIMTCFSEAEAIFLTSKIERNSHVAEAFMAVAADRPVIRAEKEANAKVFTRDLRWLCDKFSIPYPIS